MFSKLAAGREKDFRFVQALLSRNLIKLASVRRFITDREFVRHARLDTKAPDIEIPAAVQSLPANAASLERLG